MPKNHTDKRSITLPFVTVCSGYNIGDGPIDCQEVLNSNEYSSKDEVEAWELLGGVQVSHGACESCYEVIIQNQMRKDVREQLSRVGVEMQPDVGIDLYLNSLYGKMNQERGKLWRKTENKYRLFKEVREKILSIINFK